MKLTVDAGRRTQPLGDLYGIFFEDLNHAADGGLYAEMVQNRGFEFAAADHPSYHGLTAWEAVEGDGRVTLTLQTGGAVSEKNPHYVSMDITEPGTDAGIRNLGFGSGMCFTAGNRYRFSCYAKREQDLDAPLTVSCRDGAGRILAAASFGVTETWQLYELELVLPSGGEDSAQETKESTARETKESTAQEIAEEKITGGCLAITAAGRGKVYLDFVSLFPGDTYKGRKNGMRRDLAELLEAMHPRFLRFPGGCLVHDGALDPDARDSLYRWKNTVGPLTERAARRNNWGYNQTLGLGFYEYFQLCEDIGAKPLPVISPGYDPHHKRTADLAHMQPWIDDALDLIEFANGSSQTRWGSVRAQMGHEAPFGLEYLGIGNEEVGEAFFERFEVVYRAVRERYPQMKVIGTSGPFCAGGEYERGWNSARKNGVDLVDEHYYMSPEWFLANCGRYDSFRREDPKVFVGEYASWGNTWYNALAESAFMIGLEKNAHAVGLACYALLFCNVDYVNWKPDLIWFDNARSFGTANYYVQKMFMNHQGCEGLELTLSGMPEAEQRTLTPDRIGGHIYLSQHESAVRYREITLTDETTGAVQRFADCGADENAPMAYLTETRLPSYTLKLKAQETKGEKGFRIYFGWQDGNNTFCLEIGGWQNQDMACNERIAGRGSDLSQSLFTVERNREYDLELQVRGRKIRVLADGKLCLEAESRSVLVEPLYAAASREENGDVILKVANVSREERIAQLEFKGVGSIGEWEWYEESMAGFRPEDANSLEEPDRVTPRIDCRPAEERLSQTAEGAAGTYRFPPESFQILRLQKKRTD